MYSLNDFYKTKAWTSLLTTLKLERADTNNQTICEYCGKPIVKKYDCIGHHKTELTEDNYTDANIALNPDNIALVHHKCHNIIHDKLQHSRRSVYLIYGSPLSGKSTYVKSVKADGDLIVDVDSIWECVSGCDRYIKPNRLKACVFSIRDNLLDCIKYRRGKWLNAYIVGGYPLISERERLCKELGAEVIYIDTSKEECINRLMQCKDRDIEEWEKYIEDWWEKYTPPTL